MVKDLVLVLDLDGTLISVRDQSDPWKIHLRPYLAEFLLFVFANFKYVGIWTAASRKWFDYVFCDKLRFAMPKKRFFDFVWCVDRCTPQIILLPHYNNTKHEVYIKPLKKLWSTKRFSTTKHNTLTIDDLEHSYCKNKFNAISVSTYNVNKPSFTEDMALVQMQQTLQDTIQAYRKQQDAFYQYLPRQEILDILHEYRPICSLRNLFAK